MKHIDETGNGAIQSKVLAQSGTSARARLNGDNPSLWRHGGHQKGQRPDVGANINIDPVLLEKSLYQ
ncbi:hypothetical protein RA210_U30279 [Rubrivivax sp. A210]|nr:hypothetical protein RA210_U30279 [Rubrivivax sp. A210]